MSIGHKQSFPPARLQIVVVNAAVMLALALTSCRGPSTTVSNAEIPQVLVAEVVQKDVPTYTESIGTTEGFINANILPRISGYLLTQNYRDGSYVRASQLLFEIDDRPYKAALDQALGNLAQLQAQLTKNRQDLVRYTALVKARVISRQEFDAQTQATRATAAQVQAAQAVVTAAKLNLNWTRIYSPIDGVAAIAKAQVGDLVGNTTLLTTVSQLNPIKVSFPISEKEYLHFADRINARVNGTAKNSGVPFELMLDNGVVYSHPGQFYAANRQVDIQTGTIQIQATFPNPENVLRPGMYGKIRAQTGVHRAALLVPQSAVSEIQGQYEVAVVGQDNRVNVRSVTPGKKVDNLWLIDSGVRPGERVAIEGVQKVKEGMRVKPVLAHQPASAASLPAMSRNAAPAAAMSPARQE